MKVFMEEYRDDGTPRTVDVQIDPWDSWAIDTNLAHIIAPLLKQLRDTAHGFPPDMYEICGVTTEDAGADDKCAAEWSSIIDRMIWSFQETADNFPAQETFYKWFDEENQDGFMKCEIDREGLEAYEARIQDGINLFAKYYFNLWD